MAVYPSNFANFDFFRNFERPFTPRTKLRSARNFGKTRFGRFAIFEFLTPKKKFEKKFRFFSPNRLCRLGFLLSAIIIADARPPKISPRCFGAKNFARAEKVHILIRKWAVLCKEKKWPRGSGLCKKILQNAFCKFFFAISCILCQSIVVPSYFLEKHQMQMQNFLCAARARVAKAKFSPRCARQIPEKTGNPG